jgi:hypothetical protein
MPIIGHGPRELCTALQFTRHLEKIPENQFLQVSWRAVTVKIQSIQPPLSRLPEPGFG